ncbi:hypothetical protein [Alkalihalobacillus sp. BA299]|nr:hypothetical protein [Alkalihalobacillus sp. BA299]
MYTLREEAKQDFAGAMKKVAELGYGDAELVGYGGLAVKEVKKIMRER